MTDADLFEATVPVLRHYLQRIDALLSGLPDEQESLLQRRLAADAFSAAEHLETALGFALRTVFPLVGRELPTLGSDSADRDGLARLGSEVDALLEGLAASDFDGAAGRLIRHTAGAADLEQDATAFATLFALPNFFFHLCTAFAILRHGGVGIGKADFDGQHVYAAGFSFRVS